MLEQITQWLGQYESVLVSLGILSGLMFLFSLLLLPWLLGKIPLDYFQSKPEQHWHMLLQPRSLLRNLLGLPILLAGILMLVLPGQGLLTVLLGLAIMSFPGKYALERWVITRRGVLAAANWVRQRAKHPPLIIQ